MEKAGIYARVSTLDKQNIDVQIDELKDYCDKRDFDVYKVYQDKISGAKEDRPGLNDLMTDAHQRKFDIVLVWKFDRFARSIKHLVNSLEFFNSLGIQFISFKDNIDTTNPQGRFMFHIIAAVAEFEREMIRERVRSGVHRAMKTKVWGRRKKWVDKDKIEKLKEQGLSLRKIAEQTNVSHTQIKRILEDRENQTS